MARRNTQPDIDKIAGVSAFIGDNTKEETEPPAEKARAGRSKRGITIEDTSQICFRTAKAKHKALKLACVEADLEVGEALDEALDMWLASR